MKSLKFLAGATAACVLAGASGIAMAQVDTCDDGVIWLAAVDEVVVNDRSCAILDTIVRGDVTATGGSTISLTSSNVGGDVTITGAKNAFVTANTLYEGTLRVNDNQNAIVQNNLTVKGSENPQGTIVVNRNVEATVHGNIAGRKIQCQDNGSLESGANISAGADTCP
jgi:hypothetical protein